VPFLRSAIRPGYWCACCGAGHQWHECGDRSSRARRVRQQHRYRTTTDAGDAPVTEPSVVPAARSAEPAAHSATHPASVIEHPRQRSGARPTGQTGGRQARRSEGRIQESRTTERGRRPAQGGGRGAATRTGRRHDSGVEVGQRRGGAAAFITPLLTVPLPEVPKTEGLRLSLDLTDPYRTYSTVGQTLETVNSLIADPYAPLQPVPAAEAGAGAVLQNHAGPSSTRTVAMPRGRSRPGTAGAGVFRSCRPRRWDRRPSLRRVGSPRPSVAMARIRR
jgi:hypothetical protein